MLFVNFYKLSVSVINILLQLISLLVTELD